MSAFSIFPFFLISSHSNCIVSLPFSAIYASHCVEQPSLPMQSCAAVTFIFSHESQPYLPLTPCLLAIDIPKQQFGLLLSHTDLCTLSLCFVSVFVIWLCFWINIAVFSFIFDKLFSHVNRWFRWMFYF